MASEKPYFMYVMQAKDPSKAANRDGWTDYDRETFRLHMEHLEGALESGKLLLAGRTLEADGAGPAIVIFQADSQVDAQRWFEDEPFITRGFVTATLYPFSNPIMRDSA